MMMKLYHGLMQACGALAAGLIAAMTLLVCYDVIARNLGLGNLGWVLDLTEYMLPLIICVSAPWLMYNNAHIRLDLLRMVASRHLVAVVDRLALVIATVGSAIFTWYAAALLNNSREAGSLVMKTLIFPEWWVYVPVPLGFGLLCIECARQVVMGPRATGGEFLS